MIEIQRNLDVKNLTTFGIPARAAAVVFYDNADDLKEIIANKSLPRPLKQIGEGSNLLFAADFPGTILVSRITAVEIKDINHEEVLVIAGAGLKMDSICEMTANAGFWGLENLSDIPGTVGAAPVQNVGAYGVEAGQHIVQVEAVSLKSGDPVIIDLTPDDFGYRTSIFKEGRVHDEPAITSVKFKLSRVPKPMLDYGNLRQTVELIADRRELTPAIVREAVIQIRGGKLPDPKSVGSAGSFFKNPVIGESQFAEILVQYPDAPHYDLPGGQVKVPAAWLIDKSGLKGSRVGGAALWPMQPLVIVNAEGTATAADVLGLERLIINTVKEKFNITLTPEVEHICIR